MHNENGLETKGDKGDVGETGRGIGKWLRLALIGWIIVFTVVAFVALRDSRTTADQAAKLGDRNSDVIAQLKDTKVSVKTLEKTNCSLRIFLLTARRARYDSYLNEKKKNPQGVAAKTDLLAAKGYKVLADKFDGAENCKVPKKLLIPGDVKSA